MMSTGYINCTFLIHVQRIWIVKEKTNSSTCMAVKHICFRLKIAKTVTIIHLNLYTCLHLENKIVIISISQFNLFLIGVVMISVLASSAVDRGFEPRSGQTKD